MATGAHQVLAGLALLAAKLEGPYARAPEWYAGVAQRAECPERVD